MLIKMMIRGDTRAGNKGRTRRGGRGRTRERITFATFHRSGRAYQQLPPSIPNPGSRKPNSTYQSLSTRFRKTILKAFPSKSIRGPGIGKQSLNYPGSRKKETKERERRNEVTRSGRKRERERDRERERERERETEKTEPRPKRRTYDRFISPTK